MQTTRSAVDRIGDILALVVYTTFTVYNVWSDIDLYHEAFFTDKPVSLWDLLLYAMVTLFIGYWLVVKAVQIRKYRTTSWFFRNLGEYIPLLFWHVLFWTAMKLFAAITILVGWLSHKRFGPKRGLHIRLDFDDEHDFQGVVRRLERDGYYPVVQHDADIIQGEDYTPTLSSQPATVIYPASLFAVDDINWTEGDA